MSEELEGAIADALRAHGTGGVDVAALRVGALGRARTIRRRRIGLASVGVAGVLIGVGATVPRWTGLDGVPIFGAASPSTSGPAVGAAGVALSLPASDQPGAAAGPERVASDPGVLHFDVDTAALGATGISYMNYGGVESAAVWKDHLRWWYSVAQQRENLDAHQRLGSVEHDLPVTTEVFGRTATLVRYPGGFDGKQALYEITWQPTDGLWAMVRVEANDTDTAMKAVFALKLNRSQRCAVPFRIGGLPAGYQWVGCNVSLGPSKPWETSAVMLTDGKGHTFSVTIGFLGTDGPFSANTTVGGRPAQWTERSQHPSGNGVSTTAEQLFIPIQDWVNLSISNALDGSPMTEADAKQLAELVDVGGDFTDPGSWPGPAVG